MLIYLDAVDAKLLLKIIDTEERFAELPKQLKRIRKSIKIGLEQYEY